MAFTASEFPRTLVALEDITSDSMTRSELMHPVEATRAILENQTVRMSPIKEGASCIGVKAYHLTQGTDQAANGYYGTTGNSALGCDILTGDPLQTLEKNYDNNFFFMTPWQIEEDRCNNAVNAAREFAYALAFSMNVNRMKLNEKVINLLAANVQPNQWASTPEALRVVAASNRLEMNPDQFDFEGLRLIELLAKSNDISSPIVIDGTNFYLNHDIARLRGLNDNERSNIAGYNLSNLYHDYMDLDRIMARNSTFVVHAGVPVFYSHTNYQNEVPVQRSTKDDYYVLRVADPYLNFRMNGQMVRVYHEVEYKRDCLRRNAGNNKVEYGWTGQTTLMGVIDLAPAGFTKSLLTGVAPTQSLTGILEIESKQEVVV